MFAPVDYSRFETALVSPRGWAELGIVAACVLVAWLADRRLERIRPASAEHPAALQTVSLRGFAHALFPLVTVALLLVARIGYRRVAPPFFIDIALPFMVAVAGVRVVIYVLRRVFPKQPWLAVVERALTLVVLGVVVLHYTGALPEIAGELDSMYVPLGKSHISLLAIGKGLLVVVLTLIVTLWVSGMIEQWLMRSDALETNLRVVLAKSIRALLLVLAVLLSLQAVGIDLTVLTVFGGALGVGIGLGLQKLASNYIAGFTILIDRSIRIGDLVTVDNRYGMVAKVTSRYVVIRGLDGVESIVPNETLVTTTVLNHSYTSKDLRMGIPVQVSYDADVDAVLALLEEIAASEPRVLKTPAPRAFVLRFGDSGIELELGVWLNDPEVGQGDLRSALNRKILARFRERGIAIPYPQRELRMLGGAPAPPTERPAG